ncbi:unnamed protein product [Mytilus coruscus]|uniref:Uncharacterized protein n=1 Tax=Mytilus coruscus TaxID=42192 RepID=A0A6J8EUS1_MYTCO|nr:unnamed protein product [Mytilus coruscus]
MGPPRVGNDDNGNDDPEDGGGSDDDDDENGPDWFFRPFHYRKNVINVMTDEISDDSEECRSSSGGDCRKDDDFDGAHFSSGNVPNVEITVNDSSDDVFDMRPIFLAVLEENETITPKTNPKVDVPGGGVIYKSTLVSLLNEDLLPSHDKQRQQYKEKDPLTETEERVVQLFSDYAVLDKPNQSYKISQKRKTPDEDSLTSVNTNDHDDHDEIRTVVRLSPSEDGIRRSQRVKTVKWFL